MGRGRWDEIVKLLVPLQYLPGVFATLVLAPPVILMSFFGWNDASFVLVRLWARIVLLFAGVRHRGDGQQHVPPSGSYVVVSNHCSHLDAPALVLNLPHPVYFIIKKELAKIPLWGYAVTKLGFIVIDRSDSDQAREELQRAVDTIRGGRRVFVFAEGTRSPDGHLQSFKKGGFHLAVDARVPILPVAVNGSSRLLPKGGTVIHPGRIDIVVGQPIPTAGLGKEAIPELMAATRETILAARRRDPDFIESSGAGSRP
jgi:1-acyl-sn-glycerol-3-phosphate acyltransferase